MSSRLRTRARTARAELIRLGQLRSLPPRVARFHWRARMLARRMGDEFSLVSATPPPKLAVLLTLAEARTTVAELGTATGWTAIALALAHPNRRVITYDPIDRPARHAYMGLVDPDVQARIEYVATPGASAPRPVDLLYVDSTHGRADTICEFEAWQPVLRDGAVVVFDDYAHPEFPGVREAVEQLGLDGSEQRGLFVHRVTQPSPEPIVDHAGIVEGRRDASSR